MFIISINNYEEYSIYIALLSLCTIMYRDHKICYAVGDISMPKNIDNVEIKEPPIRELNKNRSCLKRSCFTGCLGFLALLLIFWGLLKFAATPRVKELKDIPEIVPESIPIYDEDSIERITYITAKEKSRLLEMVAIIPKVVVVPLYMNAEDYLPQDLQDVFDDGSDLEGWDRFTHMVRQPLFGENDVVEVHWSELAAEPSFILAFYENELEKEHFDVTVTKGLKQSVSFSTTTVSGRLTIDDQMGSDGTDSAILTISITPQE